MLNDKEFDALIEAAKGAQERAQLSFDTDAIEELITEARAMREALTWKPIEEEEL